MEQTDDDFTAFGGGDVTDGNDHRNGSPSAAAQYPAEGEVPEHIHLTACEVLCWIGYRRAIPKEVYFAPMSRRDATTEEMAALLHRSVPEPKPLECPIDRAERELMRSLRAGDLHLLVESDGRFEEVPSDIYEYAVAVNARGSIEADQKATERDFWRAHEYLSGLRPPIREVFLRTSEVLKVSTKHQRTRLTSRQRIGNALRELHKDHTVNIESEPRGNLQTLAQQRCGIKVSLKTFERALAAAKTAL